MGKTRLAVALIVLGFCMVLAGVANAQVHGMPEGAVDYKTLFIVAVGLVSGFTGAYARGLERRINTIEAAQVIAQSTMHTNSTAIATFNAFREEQMRQNQRIEQGILALQTRFDKHHYPSSFAQTGN